MTNEHTRKIMDYVRAYFELYGFNDFGIFKRCDDKTGELISADYLDGGPKDDEKLEWLSEYIGLTVDEIKNTDEGALTKYYQKYSYFHYFSQYQAECYNQGVFQDGLTVEQRILKNIFGQYCDLKTTKRYDVSSIKRRLIKKLQEINQVMPGTYHNGASIENLQISTASVISFPQISELLSSFFQMVDRTKRLFFKALETDLENEEILEYNFLVNALQIKTTSMSGQYVNYHHLMNNRDYYSQENNPDFFCYVSVGALIRSAPWKCRQFFDDPALVSKFFDTFPDVKAEMRKYYMNTSRFNCVFTWSDAKPIPLDMEYYDESGFDAPTELPKEKTQIYIEKEPEELFDWNNYLEKIKKISSSAKKGGADERKWAERNQIIKKRRNEYFQKFLINAQNPSLDDEELFFEDTDFSPSAVQALFSDWEVPGWEI